MSKWNVWTAFLFLMFQGQCLFAQHAFDDSRSYYHLQIRNHDSNSLFSLEDQKRLFELSNYWFYPERKLRLVSKTEFHIWGSRTRHLKYLTKFKGKLIHLDLFYLYGKSNLHIVQIEDTKKLNKIPHEYLKKILKSRSISSETEAKVCEECLSTPNPLSLPVQEYVRDILNFQKPVKQNVCSEVPEEDRSSLVDVVIGKISKDEEIQLAIEKVMGNQLGIVSCLEGFGYTGNEIMANALESLVATKEGLIDGEWGDAFGDVLFQHAQKNYDSLKNKNGQVSFLTALSSWSKEKYLNTALNFKKLKKEHQDKWDLILADENTALVKKAYGRLVAKNFFLSGMAALASGGEEASTKLASQVYDLVLSKIDQEKKEYLMCLSDQAQRKYICNSLGHLISSLGGLKYLINFKGSNEKLASLVNEAFEKSKLKKALNKSQLSNLERIELAKIKLGRKLNPEEARAIIEAHEIGSNEEGKKGLLAALKGYTAEQIARKARRLKEAGFTKEERRILMEEGITGQLAISPKELSQLALMKMDFLSPDKAKEIQSRIAKCRSDCSPEEMAELVLFRDQSSYLQKFNVPQKLKEMQASSKYDKEAKEFFAEFHEACVQQMTCSLEKIQVFNRSFSEFERINKPEVFKALSIKAEDGFSFLDRLRDCLKSQMCVETSYSDFEDKIKNLTNAIRNCKSCNEDDLAFALTTREFADRSENQLFASIMNQCAAIRAAGQTCHAYELFLLETYRDYRTESPVVRGNMEDPSYQSRRDSTRKMNDNIVAQNQLGNKLVEKYDMEVIHNPRDEITIDNLRPGENQAIEDYIEERGLNPRAKPDYIFYHRGEMKLVDAYDPRPRSRGEHIATEVTNKVFGKGQADHILINMAENISSNLNHSSYMMRVRKIKFQLKDINKAIIDKVAENKSKPRKLREVYANIGTLDDPVIVEVYPNYNMDLVELSLRQSKRLK